MKLEKIITTFTYTISNLFPNKNNSKNFYLISEDHNKNQEFVFKNILKPYISKNKGFIYIDNNNIGLDSFRTTCKANGYDDEIFHYELKVGFKLRSLVKAIKSNKVVFITFPKIMSNDYKIYNYEFMLLLLSSKNIQNKLYICDGGFDTPLSITNYIKLVNKNNRLILINKSKSLDLINSFTDNDKWVVFK